MMRKETSAVHPMREEAVSDLLTQAVTGRSSHNKSDRTQAVH